MLELGYTPADLDELTRRPMLRASVHWGLLVRRVGPIVLEGRPEMPPERETPSQERARIRRSVSLAQSAYDQLVRLIAVPDDDPEDAVDG